MNRCEQCGKVLKPNMIAAYGKLFCSKYCTRTWLYNAFAEEVTIDDGGQHENNNDCRDTDSKDD